MDWLRDIVKAITVLLSGLSKQDLAREYCSICGSEKELRAFPPRYDRAGGRLLPDKYYSICPKHESVNVSEILAQEAPEAPEGRW